MIATACLTFLIALASAFLPVVPVEPYLVAASITTDHGDVLLGVAAGAGQTLGKVMIFMGARGSIRSAALQRWIERRRNSARQGAAKTASWRALLRRWSNSLIAALRRPIVAAFVVLLSAAAGIPPLLAVAFYAAATPMPVAQFAAICLLGRSVRFVSIVIAPTLVGWM